MTVYKEVAADFPATKDGELAKQQLADAAIQTNGLGKAFPELKFAEATSGVEISTTALKGKVVVLDFWATWCGPCKAEMPNMKKLYAEYKDKSVEFIGVSLDQPDGGLDALKAYVKDNDITWPQYFQGGMDSNSLSGKWGLKVIPTVFVIDADGKLYSTTARNKLETMIPELLAKRDAKAVPPAQN